MNPFKVEYNHAFICRSREMEILAKIKEFNLIETKKLLPNYSDKDIMDAYLTIGGIPEYLYQLKKHPSLFLGLCNESFVNNGFFTNEYKKIFVSSLAGNKHYQKIIELLSKRRFATRSEIAQHLKTTSGGRMSELLQDLELCGFIAAYSPYNLQENSKITRYCIRDAYLQFYFKFIKPLKKDIESEIFNKNPAAALNRDTYRKWLGFSFERFCRYNSRVIANMLGFSGIRYQSGSYFNRNTNTELPGVQIDLMFERDDNVTTVCEVRYTEEPTSQTVIHEFERKLALIPKLEKRTVQKVLITAEGETQSLQQAAYFDRVITLSDLFVEHYWS